MSYKELFKTLETISIKKLNNIDSSFFTKTGLETSILNDYQIEIADYCKKNKITIDDLLKELSTNFDNNKDKDIDIFFRELVNSKYILLDFKKNIESFLLFNKKINIMNTTNNSYINPLNSKNINYFIDITYFNTIGLNTYDESNEIIIATSILLYGDKINLSLPSIGPVNNFLTTIPPKIKDKNFVKFIDVLCNLKSEDNSINDNNPLSSLNLGKILSELLLNIDLNKINNNYSYNFNNESIKKLISTTINSIDVKIEDIYYIKKDTKKNDKKKNIVKSEFIIPYKVDKDEVKLMSKSEIDKLKEFEKVIQSNNAVALFVIKETLLNTTLEEIKLKNMEKKNFKNVLACYLYYIINLLCTILKKYIDNIDIFLKNILDSKDKRFGVLNIKDAFQFTSDLIQSLFKFRFILLNNFYHLFLPSKINNGNYGMKIEHGCYIPDGSFINSNENIYNNYPFRDSEYKILLADQNIKIDANKLVKFIIEIKDNYDIYNPNIYLEFGGFSFSKEICTKSIKILTTYFIYLQKNYNFDIFIINKIIYYFKNDKNIPYELIKDYIIITNNFTLNQDLSKKIIKLYDNNASKFVNYYLKLINIRNKISLVKQTNVQNLYLMEEILELSFNTYRTKALSLIKICEKLITNTYTKEKNLLLKQLIERQNYYLKIIENQLEK